MDEATRFEAVRRLLLRSRWEGECLLWDRYVHANGYGRLRFLKRDWYAHRLMYVAVHGEVPEGKTVDHSCHTLACINPDHLRAATPQEQQWNRAGAASHSKSGIRGVRYKGQCGYRLPWVAEVIIDGREHTERYATMEEAAVAVERMRRELLPPEFVGKG